MSNKWHDLTLEQWNKLWDQTSWRGAIVRTLYTIARSPAAAAVDRLTALQTLNDGITSGALPADPGYPVAMRDILIEIVRGEEKRPWFWRRRIRRQMRERLVGVRWMLQTAYQFLPEPTERAVPGAKTPAIDALLS